MDVVNFLSDTEADSASDQATDRIADSTPGQSPIPLAPGPSSGPTASAQPSAPACAVQPERFGSAPAVLHEIRHALARLIETGEPTCIDLAALPFGPSDQEQLLDALGSGEVRASIDALGETRIQETRYSGVWLVDYYNTEGERIGLQIEIATVPRLLQAPPEGLPASLDALAARLATMPSANPASPAVSHPEGNPFSNPSVAGSKHHG